MIGLILVSALTEESAWESSCDVLRQEDAEEDLLETSSPLLSEAGLDLLFQLIILDRDFILRQAQIAKVLHILIK